MLSDPLRKLSLTAHVVSSVGWLGALAVFLAHSLASWSQDLQVVRAAALAMALTAWFVILPLSLTSLLTGLIQAFGSTWGLLRHYWVLFKLLLTVLATGVLLMKLEPISELARAAVETGFPSPNPIGLQTSLVVHAGGGLLVLLAATALAIYKPVGLTPWARPKLSPAHPGLPRWVRIFGFIAVFLLVVICVMLLGGGHGPVAHLSSTR